MNLSGRIDSTLLRERHFKVLTFRLSLSRSQERNVVGPHLELAPTSHL